LEALAELITYLDQSRGFKKTRNLLGLFKPIRGGRKIYSGRRRKKEGERRSIAGT